MGQQRQARADRPRRARRACTNPRHGNAHQLLARAAAALRTAGAMDARLAALQPALDEAATQVQEVAHSLSHYLESLEFDPARQETVERRLATHRGAGPQAPRGTGRPAGLARRPAARTRRHGERRGRSGLAARPGRQRHGRLPGAGAQAHRRARRGGARTGARPSPAACRNWAWPAATSSSDVTPLESAEPATHGADRVEFRVSTNPGQPPRAVAKIASGGELARLSLAVQVCCAPHRRAVHGVRRSRRRHRRRRGGDRRPRAARPGRRRRRPCA